MGVGDPARLVEAVALGVDLFDCVLPTRLARHGTPLTTTGRLTCSNAEHARQRRADRRHLPVRRVRPALPRLPAPPAQVGEPTAARLSPCTTSRGRCACRPLRAAVEAGTLGRRRAEVLAVWG